MAETCTSVHPQETTAHAPLPESYRTWRSRKCEPELQRTEWLYSYIDSVEQSHRYEKLLECRSFAWFSRHIESGQVRVMSNSCRLRWCPICSSARSAFLIHKVKDWLDEVKSPKFLTLTMKHTSAPLEHQIKWLYQHFRQFRQRKNIASDLRGGIWFFQLKKTDGDTPWHPHLHCVIDSKYIPQAELSAEWKAQTGTSSIVDIRAVKSKQKVAEYVSRYCARPAKLSEFSEQECVEVFTVFFGRRLCGTWGTARGVSLRPSPSADRDMWERCGSWRDIVSQRENVPRAEAIIKAFLTNGTIPRGLYVKRKALGPDEYSPENKPHVGLEDLHGNYEEFL